MLCSEDFSSSDNGSALLHQLVKENRSSLLFEGKEHCSWLKILQSESVFSLSYFMENWKWKKDEAILSSIELAVVSLSSVH